MNSDFPLGRKGLANFFKFKPGQGKSFGVPDENQLTPQQADRVRQLVASIQQRKPLMKRKPVITPALPSGARSYSVAEVGRMMQTDIRTSMIRRA